MMSNGPLCHEQLGSWLYSCRNLDISVLSPLPKVVSEEATDTTKPGLPHRLLSALRPNLVVLEGSGWTLKMPLAIEP